MQILHVIADGVHPRNQWTRRPDGLLDHNGSAYAFDDAQLRTCTAQSWSEACACTLPEYTPRHARS